MHAQSIRHAGSNHTASHSRPTLQQVDPKHEKSENPAVAALQEFVGVEEFPTVVSFNAERAKMVLNAWHNTTAWLFAPEDSELAAWFNTFASERRGEAVFVAVPMDEKTVRGIVGFGDATGQGFAITRRKLSNSRKFLKFPLEVPPPSPITLAA
jgi:hypothetical protein